MHDCMLLIQVYEEVPPFRAVPGGETHTTWRGPQEAPQEEKPKVKEEEMPGYHHESREEIEKKGGVGALYWA